MFYSTTPAPPSSSATPTGRAYTAAPRCWHLAERYGFAARLCRPYRAKTKGKVERFNGYLKGSFCVPLAATLKQTGLQFDAQAANAHIGRWLIEVANHRIHATTGERPDARMPIERAALISLPAMSASSALAQAPPSQGRACNTRCRSTTPC